MLACDTVRQDPELRIIALAAYSGLLPVIEIDPHQLVDLAAGRLAGSLDASAAIHLLTAPFTTNQAGATTYAPPSDSGDGGQASRKCSCCGGSPTTTQQHP
jgi:hypothetical protein